MMGGGGLAQGSGDDVSAKVQKRSGQLLGSGKKVPGAEAASRGAPQSEPMELDMSGSGKIGDEDEGSP
jgi:hypothetical protein